MRNVENKSSLRALNKALRGVFNDVGIDFAAIPSGYAYGTK
jgi:hypothetical protein